MPDMDGKFLRAVGEEINSCVDDNAMLATNRIGVGTWPGAPDYAVSQLASYQVVSRPDADIDEPTRLTLNRSRRPLI